MDGQRQLEEATNSTVCPLVAADFGIQKNPLLADSSYEQTVH